ncbi:MAG: Uma2 family endonuclease [Chloroflexota bacterium]
MARTELAPPASAPGEKMTYEEFLTSYDGVWAEWVDGEVIVLMPPGTRHALLTAFLTSILTIFAEVFKLGVVLSAPFQMKLGPGRSGREPDVLFIASEHLDRLLPTRLDGPADLVIEIISPESAHRDRHDKFLEYEAAGVPEYWLLDPDARQAQFYRLGANGRYELMAVDAAGVFHSEVLPGFWLRVEWLWQDPLPTVLSVIGELGLLGATDRPNA